MADPFYIPYVRAVWRELRLRLGPTGRMCLYGAGAHTRWLLSVTRDLGAAWVTCIVDDDPSVTEIEGIEVRRADCKPALDVELVLVSSDRWEEELAGRAREVFGSGVEVVRLYESLPPGPYDKQDDRAEALALVRLMRDMPHAHDGPVVVVCDQPRGREWKLAVALRSAGRRVVLLHHRSPTIDARCHFDEVLSFRSPWEALRLACALAPSVCHVMVNSDYRLAELFLRHRPGLVVVDSYDIIAGMYSDEYFETHRDFATERERERYCLEHADGLCCRSREVDHLSEALGYRLAPRVFFADGCDNQLALDPVECFDDVHVVYVGKLVPEGEPGPFLDEGRRLWLAKALAAQGIHFHLYPGFDDASGDIERHFSEYVELGRDTPFVHLHRSVAADAMPAELARYDFGLFVYNELVRPSGSACRLTDAKLRLCTSNKFYDYLDAGLPIVHNAVAGSHLAEIPDRFCAGVDVSGVAVERWGALLRQSDRDRLREGVVRARDVYDVRQHAPRLMRFYESLWSAESAGSHDGSPWFEDDDYADGSVEYRPALV